MSNKSRKEKEKKIKVVGNDHFPSDALKKLCSCRLRYRLAHSFRVRHSDRDSDKDSDRVSVSDSVKY